MTSVFLGRAVRKLGGNEIFSGFPNPRILMVVAGPYVDGPFVRRLCACVRKCGQKSEGNGRLRDDGLFILCTVETSLLVNIF